MIFNLKKFADYQFFIEQQSQQNDNQLLRIATALRSFLDSKYFFIES